MDIKHLRAFIAVADAKSFLKAADQLFISRQAITKTIDQLEGELGLELFLRSQKGAMMTPAGIFLYPRAASLVAEFDKLMQDTMDVQKSYIPTIRIALTQGIYHYYAGRLAEYGEKYRSEMQLVISGCQDCDVNTMLGDRKADAVLSFSRPNPNMAGSTMVLESPPVFLINRDDPLSSRPDLGDAPLPPLLLYTGGNKQSLWWQSFPRSEDILCSDLNYIFTLLKERKGILPIPRVLIPPYIDFAVPVPCSQYSAPIPVYFSTLYADHYTTLTYSLLDVICKDIFLGELESALPENDDERRI